MTTSAAGALVDFGWLLGFSRLVSGAITPDETQRVLAEGALTQLGVDAAAVLRIDADRLRLVASHGLPAALAGWSIDADELGDDLGRALIALAAGELADARVMPLVVGGDLYGALVLLARRPIELTPTQVELASMLVDLGATAIARAESHASLARSYAELKASREAFARTERLRILGQMAAGVSHDVKNILNPLGLQIEVVRRRLARGDLAGVADTLDTMRDVIHHGVDVVDRLRAFSRQSPEDTTETVDVERVVATAVELSRPRVALHAGVALTVATAPCPPIHARASELATAVVNLIVNATEAMPDGGTITITTGERAGEVWIAVADTGPGMPPDIERNVFEPFFTTKPEGTGLGLAMIYAFVQRFTGRITLDTAPGRGTTFTLWFPVAAA